MDEFSRTGLLVGEEVLKKFKNAKVAVFGVGGVGGYVAEALARSGVGKLVLIDNDTVSVSNINRQIIALHSTIGRYKTEVMKERILDINPEACVEVHNCFFLPENADLFDFSAFDYVVDAVDTVTAKIEIIMRAKAAGVPVISAMGAGNKLDATKFEITDIYKTKSCPLAKVMRKELRTRGVESLKVLYSTEPAIKPCEQHGESDAKDGEQSGERQSTRRSTPGSIAYVPSVAGLLLAGEVLKDIAQNDIFA